VQRAPLGALFCEFLKVSLFGFGGGIVMAHRAAVEQRQWLTEGEFADILTLTQLMPGPNVVGVAVCVGTRTRGLAGALAAFAGFVLVPGALGFALALMWLGRTDIPLVANVLRGVGPAAAGLMIGTGLRLLRPHRGDARTVVVAMLAFAGLALARFPLLLVLAILAPLSIAATLYQREAAR
jgi:chromate transporter